MLDVHVPHPTHTWKDFFIHIATIVAARIAVALIEQILASKRALACWQQSRPPV
jgi:hypothetical protein